MIHTATSIEDSETDQDTGCGDGVYVGCTPCIFHIKNILVNEISADYLGGGI